jgi:hypothetical protein
MNFFVGARWWNGKKYTFIHGSEKNRFDTITLFGKIKLIFLKLYANNLERPKNENQQVS